jgi:hypothetical protein
MTTDSAAAPAPTAGQSGGGGIDGERIVSGKVVLVTESGAGLVFRLDGERVDIEGQTEVRRDQVATSRLILPGSLGQRVIESEYRLNLIARRKRAADGTPLGDDGNPLITIEQYPRVVDSEQALRRLIGYMMDRFPQAVAGAPAGMSPAELAITLLDHLPDGFAPNAAPLAERLDQPR